MRTGRTATPAKLAGVGLITGLSLLAGGCVTDPGYVMMGGEGGSPYGFSDMHNADGSYTIRVVLPSTTRDPQNAYVYWNRRAEEICGGPPAGTTIHTAQRVIIFVDARSAQAVRGDYVLEGLATCAPVAGPATPEPTEAS